MLSSVMLLVMSSMSVYLRILLLHRQVVEDAAQLDLVCLMHLPVLQSVLR